MLRGIARTIYRAIAQAVTAGNAVLYSPAPFPVLYDVMNVASESDGGGAPYNSPAAMATGDRLLVRVIAGANGNDISAPAGFVPLAAVQVGASGQSVGWWYYDVPDATPISDSFAFQEDQSYVLTGYAFQAGTFDSAEPPAIALGVHGAANPDAPILEPGWGDTVGKFWIAATGAVMGGAISAYPLPDNNDYQTSQNSGSSDVDVGICTTADTDEAKDPGTFTQASSSSINQTIAIKGVG